MREKFGGFWLTVLAVLLSFTATTSALPGDLDTTFGGVGYVFPSLDVAGEPSRASVVQPGGKVISVGSTFVSTPNGSDAVMVRDNPDGSLDTMFDGDGIRILNPSPHE